MELARVNIRKRRSEGVVPMINVVFLLMIFFLMSTTLAPERNAGLELPESVAGEATGAGKAMVVSADGTIAWGQYRGEEAIRAAAEAHARPGSGALVVQADRQVEGAVIARLLGQLGAAGVAESALVTGGGG